MLSLASIPSPAEPFPFSLQFWAENRTFCFTGTLGSAQHSSLQGGLWCGVTSNPRSSCWGPTNHRTSSWSWK